MKAGRSHVDSTLPPSAWGTCGPTQELSIELANFGKAVCRGRLINCRSRGCPMASRIAAAGGMTSVVIQSGFPKGRPPARFMVGLLIVGLASMHSIGASGTHSLTLEERVAAQRAIEQVYWNHRIWPKENPGPKAALSAVLPDDALRAKVEDTLRKSNALEQ